MTYNQLNPKQIKNNTKTYKMYTNEAITSSLSSANTHHNMTLTCQLLHAPTLSSIKLSGLSLSGILYKDNAR